jgi:hypothetical protein
MKTLITTSIKPSGTNKGPSAKTIFSSTDTSSAKYFDISRLSGQSVTVTYDYEEGGGTSSGKIKLTIPEGSTETSARDFIVSSINSVLSA